SRQLHAGRVSQHVPLEEPARDPSLRGELGRRRPSRVARGPRDAQRAAAPRAPHRAPGRERADGLGDPDPRGPPALRGPRHPRLAAPVEARHGEAQARGARVAHRFALDHPTLLTRLVLLDIAPTYDVFAGMDQTSARARWHWLFHQVPDLPEALTAGREEVYLRYMYRAWALNPAAIEEEAVQEYVRCFRQPGA